MPDLLQQETQPTIPRWHKWFFWLNIGLISTFFAEVISGADLFPYFHFWGIVMVVPIYLLHSIVLATIVFRWGRPTLTALYFAGTLFGLYEAYITKILWNPTWESVETIRLAEVAIFETLVLVFFWHVWMSFILPLLAIETWLTNSNEILGRFPARLRRLFGSSIGWLVIAVLSGLFVSINASLPEEALLSGLGVFGVLGVSGWLWRRVARGKGYTIERLLPNQKEFCFLVLLLAGVYVFDGFILRPEAFPSWVGHMVIWLLYAVLIGLLGLALRRSKSNTLQAAETRPPQWLWAVGILTFTLFAVLAESLLLPLGWLIALLGWYGTALAGLWIALRLVWQLARKGGALYG